LLPLPAAFSLPFPALAATCLPVGAWLILPGVFSLALLVWKGAELPRFGPVVGHQVMSVCAL
jgi:hypothetical protein